MFGPLSATSQNPSRSPHRVRSLSPHPRGWHVGARTSRPTLPLPTTKFDWFRGVAKRLVELTTTKFVQLSSLQRYYIETLAAFLRCRLAQTVNSDGLANTTCPPLPSESTAGSPYCVSFPHGTMATRCGHSVSMLRLGGLRTARGADIPTADSKSKC